MRPEKFASVSRNLVEDLEEAFPALEVAEDDTFEKVRWRAAQRSVVRFLRETMEAQSETLFTET